MRAATSSAVCAIIGDPAGVGLVAGEAPRAWRANSVDTTPGITSETWMPGYACKAIRRLAVNEFSAAFAALYTDRTLAIGTRPRNDEMLISCPVPRSMKCGIAACIPYSADFT